MDRQDPQVAGRVALVTGANRGIGAEIAQQLAALGLIVAVGSRSIADGESVAAGVGAGAFAVTIDVGDPTSVDRAVASVIDRTGRIDALVNNAGGHFDDGVAPSAVSDSDALDALDVNLLGPWRCIRAVLPGMRARGDGRIVNVSSRSGSFVHTWSNAPAYGVSKAALNMLTVQLANELAGTGVLVNACCPGWVRTRMGGDDAERSVAEGADTPVWLATLPAGGPTGGFFGDRAPLEW